MAYVTIYLRAVKRRKTGITETLGRVYTTKSLTDFHAHIRASYPGAQTWRDPVSVITDFVPGMNLGVLPLVSGGERIA